MFMIEDKNTVQGTATFKIRKLNDEEKITYISPGSYNGTDSKENRVFEFDWSDSESDYCEKTNTIVCKTYSLDNKIIEDSIDEYNSNIEKMERYDLDFFKKYLKIEDLKETYLLVDINGKEMQNELLEVELISLELYDPLTDKKLVIK